MYIHTHKRTSSMPNFSHVVLPYEERKKERKRKERELVALKIMTAFQPGNDNLLKICYQGFKNMVMTQDKKSKS